MTKSIENQQQYEATMLKTYSIRVYPKNERPFTARIKARTPSEALCIVEGMFTDAVKIEVIETRNRRMEK